jgi:hypothetical protein
LLFVDPARQGNHEKPERKRVRRHQRAAPGTSARSFGFGLPDVDRVIGHSAVERGTPRSVAMVTSQVRWTRSRSR